jgi:betaine-aldehyde dehydrogenase
MGLELLIGAPGGPVTAKSVLHNVIGGEAAEPADGRYEDLVDPATGEVFASAPVSGKADVDRAMAAAAGAFE